MASHDVIDPLAYIPGGCIPPPPPLFWVGGWPVQTSPPPPLFEDKIRLKFDIYCKETDLFNCKTIKNSKNRSLARTQMYSETRYLAVLPVHVFFFWHHLCIVRCRIKQTLCNIMARKSIAGLLIIQVKGTWRSQGGIILAQKSPMTEEWNSPLKYCTCRFFCAQSLVHIKQYFWNLIYKMYFILPVWCK